MADTPGLVVLIPGLLLGLRREPGQGVQVGDDPAQHPQDAGAVERDELRLRVRLGAEVHDDPLAALQEPQPVAALAQGGCLRCQAGLEVGRALGSDRRLTTLLAEPAGDLLRLVRSEELVDAAPAEPRGGRDLADGQATLVGLDDGPDPLLLGFFEPFLGEPQPVGDLPFAADLLAELIVGFHHVRLSDAAVPVQKTGRQSVGFCAAAIGTPDPVHTTGNGTKPRA